LNETLAPPQWVTAAQVPDGIETDPTHTVPTLQLVSE
jgi:hypothetical protein